MWRCSRGGYVPVVLVFPGFAIHRSFYWICCWCLPVFPPALVLLLVAVVVCVLFVVVAVVVVALLLLLWLLLLGPTPRGGLLFFHVTAACSFFEHFTRCRCLACMSHMLASAQGGYNVPDEFKTAGHRGPWVHVTCCCCWHVAHARSLMQQGVGGGVITLLTTLTYFNTVGQNGSSVSNINNILCRSWPNSSKQRTAAEERQRRAEEHMRALRAKANVDTSQSFVLICFEYWPDRDDHKNYIVKVKDT